MGRLGHVYIPSDARWFKPGRLYREMAARCCRGSSHKGVGVAIFEDYLLKYASFMHGLSACCEGVLLLPGRAHPVAICATDFPSG